MNPLTFSLLDWTRSNAEVTVVYAFVECHGGNCDQAGFVARNGAIVHVEPWTEAFERLETPLDRLLRYLGITLQGGYFEPLTRDYFQSLS